MVIYDPLPQGLTQLLVSRRCGRGGAGRGGPGSSGGRCWHSGAAATRCAPASGGGAGRPAGRGRCRTCWQRSVVGDFALPPAARLLACPGHVPTESAGASCPFAQAERRLAQGLLRRCFSAWRSALGARRWKGEVALREEHIRLLTQQVRGLQARPVLAMRRRRLQRWLHVWQDACQAQRAQRLASDAAAAHYRRAQLRGLCAAWQQAAQGQRAKRAAEQAALRRLHRLRLRQALLAWRGAVGQRQRKEQLQAAAWQLGAQRAQRRAFAGWRHASRSDRTARAALRAQQQGRLATAFQAWRQRTAVCRARDGLLLEAQARQAGQRLRRAFWAWLGHTEGRRARQLQASYAR